MSKKIAKSSLKHRKPHWEVMWYNIPDFEEEYSFNREFNALREAAEFAQEKRAEFQRSSSYEKGARILLVNRNTGSRIFFVSIESILDVIELEEALFPA